MKHYWRYQQLAHTCFGVLSGILTLTGAIIALNKMQWRFVWNQWHNASGIIFSLLGLLLVLNGLLLLLVRRKFDFEWKTRWNLVLSTFHKVFGYLVILTVQIAVISGIMRRVEIGLNNQSKKVALVLLNVGIIVGTLVVGEITHQVRKRREFLFTPRQFIGDRMSREEFAQAILEFKKYVIVDDRVVDVSDYMEYHPGGRFLLNQCVGKDISKFFYGGYSLEGNLDGAVAEGHNHSYYARRIANDLTIAIFEKDI